MAVVDEVDGFEVVVFPGVREERLLGQAEDLVRLVVEVWRHCCHEVHGMLGPGAVEFEVHEFEEYFVEFVAFC